MPNDISIINTSLRRLRTLIDRTHDGILLIEIPSGIIVDCNASALRISGRPLGELNGATIERVVGRTAWKRLSELVDGTQTDPAIRRHTIVEIPRHNGNSIIELSIGYHGFEDGLFGVVVMQDVTERDHAVRALEATHRRLRDVVEFLPDPTLVLDSQGVVLEWNKGMERLTGVPKQQVLGKGDMACSKSIHGRRVALLAHRVLGLESVAELPEYEVSRDREGRMEAEVFLPELRGGRGAYVWATASALRDRNGEVVGAIESIRDITEQRDSKQALIANQRELRATLDSISDALVATDSDGLIRRLNPAAEQLTGWMASEAIGKPMAQVVRLLEGASRAVVDNPEFHIVRAKGESSSVEDYLLISTDGTERRISARGSPILDERGGVLGIVVVLRDVTEQRSVEKRLMLSQKMESIGRLAGGVAHDFNNILAAVRGYAGVVAEELEPDSPLHEDVREILVATERATDLTRRLLAFSRHEVVEPRVVDLHEVINGTKRMLARIIGEDIELRMGLDSKSCVMADPVQLEQVLVNLVLNARDAMPLGGVLSISTRDIDLSEDGEAMLVRSDRWVRLEVSDTGIGMDEEVRTRMFEPFFTTKPMEKGTGIGFPTTLVIVHQLGGTLRVESTEGVGSTFEIDLPAVKCVLEDAAISSTRPVVQAANATVLLVEDEPMLLRLGRRVLGKRGYVVLTAANGVEALELARVFQGTIDILVTDVVMPKMGGVELSEALLKVRPGIKTLFVSGYSSDEVVQRGMAADAPGFLGKPFTAGRLVQKVQELLGNPDATHPK